MGGWVGGYEFRVLICVVFILVYNQLSPILLSRVAEEVCRNS